MSIITKSRFTSIALTILIFFTFLNIQAQNNLAITQCQDSLEVIALVDSVLLFGLYPTQFKNISFKGNPGAVGYFYNGEIFGFEKSTGIVMSSGFAGNLDQSNACSGFLSGATGGGSDADLSQLGGTSINDACIIEFDFKPPKDTVKFNLLFGSEEYHEWVSPLFADVLGLFMSGPNINGPYTNNAINIAVVPGTNDAISIGKINCGDEDAACTPPPGNGPNCELLIDNGDQAQSSFGQFALDAYTVPIVSENGNLDYAWYHIKIAIGDAGDNAYDTGLFFEKGSFVTIDVDSLDITIADSVYCDSTFLQATPGFETYFWNTGDTTSSIMIYTGGEYNCEATNEEGITYYAEFIAPYPAEPYQGEEICLVMYSADDGFNQLIVEPTIDVGIDSILFFKQDNQSSTYIMIGVIGVEQPGLFLDDTTDPNEVSQRYKIAIKDNCGNISGLSPYHRTMLLQANKGINNEVNLSWNPYEGFPYPNFEIYRSVNSEEFIQIGSTPNDTYTYTDLTPPDGQLSYQVMVLKDPSCDPERAEYNRASSNEAELFVSTLDENKIQDLKSYPNPAKQQVNISYYAPGNGKAELQIYNNLGELVFEQEVINSNGGQNVFIWKVNQAPPGMYYFHLNVGTQQGHGKIILTKDN